MKEERSMSISYLLKCKTKKGMRTVQKMMFSCILIVTINSIGADAFAQSPYGFRGPTRNGIYQESELLKNWPSEGPEQIWETLDAGKGYSSPVIAGDRIYLTGMNEDEDKEIFSAYSKEGKKLYEVVYGSPWKDSYPETRTTPMIVENKAYVISGMGEVVCLNTENGDIIWKVDGETEFGRKTGTWGISECPLVFDNKIVFSPGGEQTAMVALDAETGATIWKSKSMDDISNYASPILITYNGKKQIVNLTGKYIIGVNPDNGNIEWTFDDWGQAASERGWEKISPNAPQYRDGKIFVSNGYDIGALMLQLNEDATSVSLVWRNDDLDTHHGSYVLVDGTIYGSNWINNNSGNWMGVDWNTGETKFENEWEGSKGKGSIIAADGMLIAYDERRGTVGLVRPGTEKFDVVSEFRITKGEGPHWAHPVVDNGILYIRHGNAFAAYKIK